MSETKKPRNLGPFGFDVTTNLVASLVVLWLVALFTPLTNIVTDLLPDWIEFVLAGAGILLFLTVAIRRFREVIWHPVARFVTWLFSLFPASRRRLDLPKLARLIVRSPNAVISGFVPRELMEALRVTRAGRRAPDVKLLTPQRSLVYDETARTLPQLIVWQDGVVGLSNYIGGLRTDERSDELEDFILSTTKPFTGCVVHLGKVWRRTFTVTALPDHHPEFTDEVTIVTEVVGKVRKSAEKWVNRMLADARPVRMREVLCAEVPGLSATGTDGQQGTPPAFAAKTFANFGNNAQRIGMLVPRVAVIARFQGPGVLFTRRDKRYDHLSHDQDKLSILTQRIQDIDLLEVAKRLVGERNDLSEAAIAERWSDAGDKSLEAYRGMFGIAPNKPFVLPLDVYRAAAVRESLLSLGVVDAEARLVFEQFVVLNDDDERCQKGFAIFSLELRCDGDDDEVVRALDLNRRKLIKVDRERMANEIHAGTANDLIKERSQLISQLSFTA